MADKMTREQNRQLQAFLGRHDIKAIENEANTYAVVCSCGYKAAANYGVVQATEIVAKHFRSFGLEIDPQSVRTV